MSNRQMEDNPPELLTINILDGTLKVDVQMVDLSKSQKKRINKNKTKKELNQNNPITGNKITIYNLEFDDNPFKDKEFYPYCFLKYMDDTFNSICDLFNEKFEQVKLNKNDYKEIAEEINRWKQTT